MGVITAHQQHNRKLLLGVMDNITGPFDMSMSHKCLFHYASTQHPTIFSGAWASSYNATALGLSEHDYDVIAAFNTHVEADYAPGSIPRTHVIANIKRLIAGETVLPYTRVQRANFGVQDRQLIGAWISEQEHMTVASPVVKAPSRALLPTIRNIFRSLVPA